MPRLPANPIRRRARRILLASVLLCAGPLLGWGGPENPQPPQPVPPAIDAPDTAALPQGSVTRVLDTDTLLLKVDGKPLRIDLLGVSAATTTSTRADDPDATAAVSFLEHLLLGETVAIQYDPKGEYTTANKRAAYLFRAPDNLFVNLELVRQGYARHTDSSMSIHLDAFAYYQQRARDLERGVWDPDRPAPAPATPVQAQPNPQPATLTTTSPHPLDPAADDIVYITKYGKSYHRKDCPHLTDTQRPMRRDDLKNNYTPCKTCKPDD